MFAMGQGLLGVLYKIDTEMPSICDWQWKAIYFLIIASVGSV